MKRLLITSATHSLGLRVANMLEGKYEVVLSTSEDLPAFMQSNYLKIPKGINSTFAHEMLKSALDNNCQYILPLQLSEIETLAESLLLFEEYGIQVICPSKSQLEELEILANPIKDMSLSLLLDNMDLLNNRQAEVNVDGLGVLSDSGLDFLLVVAN
ncbi:hypothetical protein [Sphingobacterium bovistauri]|uniref:SDR family NAD(P)-dependent oxidoreductase n=1 Tax=Sphingobacterium bovistauri TaxID=2781959 RepID=A0ABS7ZB83_9SPHI|nr:hypothetical protein [Sphingobacterium bovistauri]MCA5006189.1 hypothetical protein [Sphingobacterium bovistauri]